MAAAACCQVRAPYNTPLGSRKAVDARTVWCPVPALLRSSLPASIPHNPGNPAFSSKIFTILPSTRHSCQPVLCMQVHSVSPPPITPL
jgi:hypothetical protein